MLPMLDLPAADFRLRENAGGTEIFDLARKKWVSLTPEEWVRQHMINYLSQHKFFPISRMAVEFSISVNTLSRRCDIVLFGKDGKPKMIVECKAPGVKLSQQTIDQAARYNIPLKVPYLLITNGLSHFCSRLDHIENNYEFLAEIPDNETVEKLL
jgi:type I site-specific restriction endonuclease